LPPGHTLAFSEDGTRLSLFAPETGGGGIYETFAIREEEDEVYVLVGDFLAGGANGDAIPAYPFPSRAAVTERLRRNWINSGGDPRIPSRVGP
jgi:hypothetical protein